MRMKKYVVAGWSEPEAPVEVGDSLPLSPSTDNESPSSG